MGSGTMNCKSYITKRGYYLAYDYDEKVGGEFWFLLLPLYGNNNERLFYVKDNFNGSFTVEGECYIITNKEALRRYIADAGKELKGKPVWYYHTDEKGEIIRKEKSAP